MSRQRLYALFGILVAGAIHANAMPITWYLQGVTFADGTTATGSFVYDVDNGVNGTFSNVSITTVNGSIVTTYGGAVTTFSFINPNAVSYSLRVFPTETTGDLTNLPELNLHFPAPGLTDAGGTVNLIINPSDPQVSGVDICNDSTCYTSKNYIDATAGAVSTTPASAFQVRYVANLNVGDSIISITNDGASSNGSIFSPGGNLCVNVYAFDPSEELLWCCSLPVTPNGLANLSALSISNNLLTPENPTSFVIKLLATSCDTGAPAAGMHAWATTLHALPTTPTTFGVTETPFSAASLSTTELTHMNEFCSFIISNGTGHGTCPVVF